MSDQPNSDTLIGASARDEFVWSPDQMITRLGGDEELARQLVTLFLDECPRMMAQVRESVERGTPDLIRRAAHAFKGSVSNFATGGPAETAFALETIGREERMADAPAVLALLERQVNALTAQLRAFDAGTPDPSAPKAEP
jgi:HPt (histidine-containing phosphotransfer) domain-containing protein